MKTFFVSLLVAGFVAQAPAQTGGVTITNLGDRLRIEIGGELFTEYHFQNVYRPFLYPIIGPGGAGMTRNWPMKEVGNEETDHPHHRGLWFAHGEVNGVDFWSVKADAGKTVHQKFLEITSGTACGVVREANDWITPDGVTIGSDTRTIRFYPQRMLDFEITLEASHGELKFGDTKEGTMAIRVAPSIAVKGKWAHGHLVNSTGLKDVAVWGKRADWVDDSGPVNDKIVGVAIFDHPANPKHPTWWHARDYGLVGANPFGVHDFEKKPAGTGAVTIPAGSSLTWRYRFIFHEGDAEQAKIAERYREYAQPAR